jgi:hypothetical protein
MGVGHGRDPSSRTGSRGFLRLDLQECAVPVQGLS